MGIRVGIYISFSIAIRYKVDVSYWECPLMEVFHCIFFMRDESDEIRCSLYESHPNT